MTQRLLKGLCAAMMGVALTGCSLFGSDAYEPAPLVSITPEAQFVPMWTAKVGESSGFLTPAVVSNAVYAAGGKTLSRFEAESGATVWTQTLPENVAAGVGTDGLTVAVVTVDGVLRVFDNEGKGLWTIQLPTDTLISPLVGRGLVVVETADSRVTAFDARTGEMLWNYLGQVPTLTLRTYKALAFSPAGILVGQPNGRLIVLDDHGKLQFDVQVGIPKGVTEIERLSDVVGMPMVAGNTMCAAAYQGDAVCLSLQNGQLMWAQAVNAVSGTVAGDEAIYVTDAKGFVHAYDEMSGQKRWDNTDLLYRLTSTPVVMTGGVAVGDFEGVLTLMDAKTGRQVGRTSISGAVVAPPQPINGGAIFQTVKGTVVRMNVQPGRVTK